MPQNVVSIPRRIQTKKTTQGQEDPVSEIEIEFEKQERRQAESQTNLIRAVETPQLDESSVIEIELVDDD